MKNEQIELIRLSPVVLSQHQEKNLSFKESLEAVRKERELTICEIAEKTRQATRTIQRWIAGDTVPELSLRHQVLEILSDPNASPSEKTRRRVEESHHLIWDKQKGWETRITIQLGKKRADGQTLTVSKRIRRRLKTRNLSEAIIRRDILVATLTDDLKLTVNDRRQKRRNQKD